MTPPRCRPDGFRSLRRAKRAAWLHSDSTGKTVTPVRCTECGLLHLAAEAATTLHTTEKTGT